MIKVKILPLLESLKRYFKNTSKEQLDKDWEEISSKYNYGPTVEEWLEYNKENIKKAKEIYGSNK